MIIVFEKLEDPMQVFLPECPQITSIQEKNRIYLLWTFNKILALRALKRVTNNQKYKHFTLIFLYLAFFKNQRYLWTLPGRKTCMWSSSFPSTITIPNFKSIALTVGEFWKRYHQNIEVWWKSGVTWWLKKSSRALIT